MVIGKDSSRLYTALATKAREHPDAERAHRFEGENGPVACPAVGIRSDRSQFFGTCGHTRRSAFSAGAHVRPPSGCGKPAYKRDFPDRRPERTRYLYGRKCSKAKWYTPVDTSLLSFKLDDRTVTISSQDHALSNTQIEKLAVSVAKLTK